MPLDADYFIRELAKIDPATFKKFNLEIFLIREDLEAQKQAVLGILYAYIEKR